MILVEHRLRLADADLWQIFLGPRQIDDPVEVGADHAGLGTIHALLGQSPQLMGSLLFNILWRVQIGDLAPQLVDRVIRVLVLAQLAADNAHLLA
jgi:hypothetical protein